MAATMRDTVGAVKEKASEALEGASGWAEDTMTGFRIGRAKQGVPEIWRYASPILSIHAPDERRAPGICGGKSDGSRNCRLAAGMLIGALLPRTRRENEAFGEWADELRHQGVRYAREATQKGREFVEESFEGEDPRFSKHESEFKSRDNLNRH